jgi:hypothetical protein
MTRGIKNEPSHISETEEIEVWNLVSIRSLERTEYAETAWLDKINIEMKVCLQFKVCLHLFKTYFRGSPLDRAWLSGCELFSVR